MVDLAPPLELIRVLADGELHSGEELAQVLKISRTAIWKQIKKLDSFGLIVESFPSKGYQLQPSLSLLNIETIKNNLSPAAGKRIDCFEIFPAIDSTNSYLLAQPAEGNIRICAAEFQEAGRGRRGRAWVSPFAQNIYLSLSMQLESGLAGLEGLSLSVGVVLAEALQAMGVENLKLKWPNDILLCEKNSFRKLGGILIEAQGDTQGSCKLVVGIGLNVQKNHYSDTMIDQPWICLESALGRRIDRNNLLGRLIEVLIPLLSQFEQKTFAHYKERWLDHCAFHGDEVQLGLPSEKISGQLVGVDDRGALILKTAEGLRHYHGGEISVRKISESS